MTNGLERNQLPTLTHTLIGLSETQRFEGSWGLTLTQIHLCCTRDISQRGYTTRAERRLSHVSPCCLRNSCYNRVAQKLLCTLSHTLPQHGKVHIAFEVVSSTQPLSLCLPPSLSSPCCSPSVRSTFSTLSSATDDGR